MSLAIQNVTVYTPHQLRHGMTLLLEGRHIKAVEPAQTMAVPAEATVIDGTDLIAAPGFIDVQLNGAFGYDFTLNPQDIWPVAERLPQFGVTSFLPTIITAPWETYHTAQAVLRAGCPDNFHGQALHKTSNRRLSLSKPTSASSVCVTPDGAKPFGWHFEGPFLNPQKKGAHNPARRLSLSKPTSASSVCVTPDGAKPLGWHFEGPFLNPQKKGAHNPAYLQPPDAAKVENWSVDTHVRLVTLAPELPGALPLIHRLAERGVVVSAGHSMASFEQAQAGFEAGIRYGTHLFNAMPTLHHREPGLVGALLDDSRPTVGLIPDGVHCQPSMVRLARRTLGHERLNLVTDGMAALGMPPGSYVLGDFGVTVTEDSARLADGTLAGSVLSLDQAVRNLMAYSGCSLAEALPSVTSTPAKLLGLGGQLGHIAPGTIADLVLLTAELAVATTIVDGRVVYQTPS